MADALTITREWFELLEGLPTVQSRWNVLYAVSRFAFDNVEPESDDLTAIEKSVFMMIRQKIKNRKCKANYLYKKRHKNSTVEPTVDSTVEPDLFYSRIDSRIKNPSSNQHSITDITPHSLFKNKQDSPHGEKSTARRVFKVPTLEEVKAYIRGKGYSVDPEEFYSFYESQGWHVGKNKMRDWHKAVSYWQCRQNNRFKTKTQLRDYSGI